MSETRNLLLVQGESEPPEGLEEEIRRRGYRILRARRGSEAFRLLREGGPVDVVIADLDLDAPSGTELAREVLASGGDEEVILLAGEEGVESALEVMKLGARGYLLKPFSTEELLAHLAKAEEHHAMAATMVKLKDELSRRGGDPAGLVGSHPSMRELDRIIGNVCRLDADVLVLGESGTGKELVARAIHRRGPRAGEPFVGINCGSFARSLLEDQLFGHVRGAFTGAAASRDGVFVSAGKGTLFLDEIAELDVTLQGRLLRAIQEREVVPLGTNRPVTWRSRLITATNQDIEKLVAEGRFRSDLYYRINVVEIRIPPLRERREDIPSLVDHFLDRLAEGRGPRKRVSPGALDLLLKAPYPGNVRELRNVIERAHALGRSEVIEPEDLPGEFREITAEASFKSLAQVEREHILRALLLAGGRKTRAAKLLEIDRNRLNRMIKKYGIAGVDPGGEGGA